MTAISSDGTNVWATDNKNNIGTKGYVYQINCNTVHIIGIIEVGNGPKRISSDGKSVWTTNITDDTVSQIYIPPPCFNKNTQILTNKGYCLVQDLRVGDLIKSWIQTYSSNW